MAVHERRAAALVEAAADRLGVVRTSAEAVAAEARELADPDLAVRVERALHTVTGALGAQAAEDALEAVGALERLLPEAEARLDELQLAFTRRSDLAEALQDAMCGEGFTFTEGSEQGAAFVLRFERPSGARYETTVATEADGTPVLVYHVEGEPDVTLHPAAEGAVCATVPRICWSGCMRRWASGTASCRANSPGWANPPEGRPGRCLVRGGGGAGEHGEGARTGSRCRLAAVGVR
ncbi:hypothetical protein IHE61_27985 [Streptomyces sp. GKU 257-1]|nr:hypothetical protein [Streptomyces sp. GKU 257-1]